MRRLLHKMGYSLQAPAKQNEGSAHPDRDGQFGHINALATERVAAGEPVMSVDTKKNELIGTPAIPYGWPRAHASSGTKSRYEVRALT